MIIKKIVAREYLRQVPSGLWNPVHEWGAKSIVLVFVLTEDGKIGVGEASTGIGSGSPVMAALKDELAPMVLGRSVDDGRAIAKQVLAKLSVNQTFGTFGHGWGAIDIALWDLIGQQAGLPIHKMLSRAKEQVYGYASAGLYRDGETPDDLAQEVAGYVGEGYDGFKLKIGGLSLAEDVKRTEAVRGALGSGGRLMIDGAGAIRSDIAEQYEVAMRDLAPYWFEAPIAVFDEEGLARFRSRTKTPIAAHEILFGLHAYDRLIRMEMVDFVQFNVTCCGGITEALRIGARASAANLQTTLQYSGSFVGLAASLQVASVMENCDSVEIHMVHRWLEEFRDGGEWTRQGSQFTLNDRPGIGLSNETREALMEGS